MWRMRAAVDITDRGECDGYTEMTILQKSIECSDVSYKEHWWQI